MMKVLLSLRMLLVLMLASLVKTRLYFHAFNTKPNKITLAYGARVGEEIFKIRLPNGNK